MDWLERAADAKLIAKSSDVNASWAATEHLQKACLALGALQVSTHYILGILASMGALTYIPFFLSHCLGLFACDVRYNNEE